jgi:hypothetical protein
MDEEKKPKYKIKENKVIIHFDRKSKEVSKTGKSIILASSRGFIWEGDIGISFNIIKKK